MSIQNAGQRRISMFSFAGIFLITVVLSCIVFIKSFESEDQVSKERMEELETKVNAFEEKEGVLNKLADLSQALQEYDKKQQTNPLGTSSDLANCSQLLKELYQLLNKAEMDTTLYHNTTGILNMAEQYMASIESRGINTDDQVNELKIEIESLENKVEDLRNQKNDLQNQLLVKNQEIVDLKIKLLEAKQRPPSGGGGGSSSTTEETIEGVDCELQLEKRQQEVLRVVKEMQKNIQLIQDRLDDIGGILGIKKHKKEKEEIETHIKALEKNLTALQKK